MGLKSFKKIVRDEMDSMMMNHGYQEKGYPDRENTMLCYRKNIYEWYIFIDFNYDTKTVKGSQRFHVSTMRLKQDYPYMINIRDENGKYIVGSLIGTIYRGEQGLIGWFYHSDEELRKQLHIIKEELQKELIRLEDLSISMDYK